MSTFIGAIHVTSIYTGFQFGGESYVLLDNTAGAYDAATDILVHVDGLQSFTAADFIV